jgi:hypothetical protein
VCLSIILDRIPDHNVSNYFKSVFAPNVEGTCIGRKTPSGKNLVAKWLAEGWGREGNRNPEPSSQPTWTKEHYAGKRPKILVIEGNTLYNLLRSASPRNPPKHWGFEPTLEFPLNTLSKRAPSATRPSLRRQSVGKEQLQ